MPFKSCDQEMAMKIHAPEVWKQWVQEYGHAKGWDEYKKRKAKKAARTRNKK